MSVFTAIHSGIVIIEGWIIVLSASFGGLYLHNYYTLNVMFLLHIPNTFKIVYTMCTNVQTMCKQCAILCAIFYTFSTHLRSRRGYYTLGAGGRGTLEWDETRWAPQPIKANSPLSIETKFLYSRPQLLPLTKRNVTLGYFVTHIFSSIG